MKKKSVVISLIVLALAGFNFIGKKKLTPLSIPLPDHVTRSFHSPNFPAQDNPASKEGFELGRRLFYDKNLSSNKTISCASCHIQEFAFSDTARFSRGTVGQTGDRNSMPLANIGWGSRFFWDGRAPVLTDQIHAPVEDTREMDNTWEQVTAYVKGDERYQEAFKTVFRKEGIRPETIKKAIAQFVGNIYSFSSKYDAYFYNGTSALFTEQEQNGMRLFNGKARCNNCHNTVLFSNHQFMNNGLDAPEQSALGLMKATGKETDRALQKTPSLRNIALTPPYMHDGRFATLAAVLAFYNSDVHPNSPNIDFRMDAFTRKGGLGLTHQEQKDIIAFLHTLTDTTLGTNPLYANPWKE